MYSVICLFPFQYTHKLYNEMSVVYKLRTLLDNIGAYKHNNTQPVYLISLFVLYSDCQQRVKVF